MIHAVMRSAMRSGMRAAALALTVLGGSLPASAVRAVSVAALEQMLTAQEAAHKGDSALAQELSDVELTERLTGPALQRITNEAKPGPQTTQALEMLADASALLVPPASEVPDTGKPDMAAQRALFSGAVDYVVKTLRHLPDFLATRETRSFNDSPNVVGHSGYAPVTPMHLAGTFRHDITYREGKEVVEAAQTAAQTKDKAGPTGLTTWGEFGPVLAIILTDSLKGRVTWSRWEQDAQGRVAVFHYAVPASGSHYHVDFCCAWQDQILQSSARAEYHGTPGYHGELFLDPKSGAIVRVTLEAELGPAEVIRRAAISVEYGEVEIGGTKYICPVRSVAISEDMDRPGKVIGGAVPVRRINETTFTGYHRFGSESRILMAGAAPAATPSAAAETGATSVTSAARENPPDATTAAAPATAAGNATGAATVGEQAAPPAAAAMESAAPATPTNPANGTAAPEEHATAETSPAAKEQSAEAPPVFKTTARDVVLDVVVTKGNGDAVTGLGQQDFAVTEDGKAQAIDFFEGHTAGEQAKTTNPQMPEMPEGVVTNVPPASVGDTVNVLLLDSLNTPPQDQVFVHKEIQDFLSKMKPGTRMAVFTLGTKLHFVQGFTTDSGVLLAALKQGEQGEKHGLSRGDAADSASEVAELQAMRASGFAIDALQAAQAQASSEDVAARATMTFQALTYLAHYLSGVPGRKNLLWFASSFPVVIFPSQEETKSIEKNPALRGYMERVKQTADLFAESQISVYPIGAEGMMTEHAAEANTMSPVAAPNGIGHIGDKASDTTMSPYAQGAGERADVVNSMEQLAASTGGKAFYNTNDLNGAMEKAIDDGANYYTIGYSPADKTMDGSFRRIDVKVTHGKYKLAYRHGYNAEETPVTDPKTANPLTDLLGYGLPGATGVLYGVDAKAGPTEEESSTNRAGANTALAGMVTRYRVDFTIRAGDVEMKQDAQGGRSGRLLLGLKVYDRDGNAVNWEGDDETLQLKESEYAALLQRGIPVHLMIDVPARDATHLVTAVYDWNSGRAGTLEVPLGTASGKLGPIEGHRRTEFLGGGAIEGTVYWGHPNPFPRGGCWFCIGSRSIRKRLPPWQWLACWQARVSLRCTATLNRPACNRPWRFCSVGRKRVSHCAGAGKRRTRIINI